MLSSNNWPQNMEYLTCNNYTGSNTPNRSLDLRSFFVNVSDQKTSYGKFEFANDEMPFNGNSLMKFDMDVLIVSIRGGMDYRENVVGKWTAGLSSTLMIKSNTSIEQLKSSPIYRVYTVIVRFIEHFHSNHSLWPNPNFSYSTFCSCSDSNDFSNPRLWCVIHLRNEATSVIALTWYYHKCFFFHTK